MPPKKRKTETHPLKRKEQKKGIFINQDHEILNEAKTSAEKALARYDEWKADEPTDASRRKKPGPVDEAANELEKAMATLEKETKRQEANWDKTVGNAISLGTSILPKFVKKAQSFRKIESTNKSRLLVENTAKDVVFLAEKLTTLIKTEEQQAKAVQRTEAQGIGTSSIAGGSDLENKPSNADTLTVAEPEAQRTTVRNKRTGSEHSL